MVAPFSRRRTGISAPATATDLVAALEQDDAAEVREMVRGLVERVTLFPEGNGQRVEVRGELAAIRIPPPRTACCWVLI